MKSVNIEICVCTACVIGGAVDILDTVTSLQQLEKQLGTPLFINLGTVRSTDYKAHSVCGPVVTLNGLRLQKATGQDLASRIFACAGQGAM